MKHIFRILFLLAFLFGLSASRAWACGNDAGPVSEKSCCSSKNDPASAHCADKMDACDQNHPGQSCPDQEGCGGSHCPCGMVAGCHAGALLVEMALPPVLLHRACADTLRQAFYFAQHMPEEVYLAIWQPPKPGV